MHIKQTTGLAAVAGFTVLVALAGYSAAPIVQLLDERSHAQFTSPSSSEAELAGESDCMNSIDDDGDGDEDCADSDCDGFISCDGGGPETQCTDDIDNDDDGYTDCNDPNCDNDPSCYGGFGDSEVCDDSVDNDGDGDTDCNDSDCDG